MQPCVSCFELSQLARVYFPTRRIETIIQLSVTKKLNEVYFVFGNTKEPSNVQALPPFDPAASVANAEIDDKDTGPAKLSLDKVFV